MCPRGLDPRNLHQSSQVFWVKTVPASAGRYQAYDLARRSLKGLRRSLARSALVSVMAAAALAASGPALARAESRSALHGTLAHGAHDVGFTRIQMADPARPSGPKRAGNSAADADRSRKLDVHVWYPARRGSAIAPMTFADAMVAHLAGRPAADLSRRDADVRRFMAQFGAVTDDAWARLKQAPLLARPDAPAADGRFPLIVGSLRPLSTTVTNEYLASHGYVVAMVDGDEPDLTDPGAGLDIAYRDMEFAIPELRKRPYVDRAALGALGFSGSGFSQLLLAMRHPDVDAVCDLESAIFDNRMMFPLSRGWGYDVEALRVPFLHTYSVPLSKLENRIADFEAMRYSTRYRYLVDAPGIHHWDFATEGMAASAVLGVRGQNGPALQQAFETTNRYVLQFFNAYVKHDREAVAFLRRDPQANGVPAGLVTVREHPAIQPAPTLEAIEEMVRSRGIDAAVKEMDAARAVDPRAAVFREASLNRLGYRLLRTQKTAEAIVIFRKAVDLFPASSNPYDSLSEALEAAGERAQSVEVAQQGLEVLARQDLNDEQRRDMANLLEARLKRLR